MKYTIKVSGRSWYYSPDECISLRDQLLELLPLGKAVYVAKGDSVYVREWKPVDTLVGTCVSTDEDNYPTACSNAAAMASAMNAAISKP